MFARRSDSSLPWAHKFAPAKAARRIESTWAGTPVGRNLFARRSEASRAWARKFTPTKAARRIDSMRGGTSVGANLFASRSGARRPWAHKFAPTKAARRIDSTQAGTSVGATCSPARVRPAGRGRIIRPYKTAGRLDFLRSAIYAGWFEIIAHNEKTRREAGSFFKGRSIT